MSTAIGKRIARLEDELLPKPAPKVTVLTEPGPDAEPAAVAVYLEQLEQARRNQDKVVVIGFRLPGQPMHQQVAGVTYVESEWEATVVTLAGQPSEFGNKSAFEDLLKSLSGRVLGVVTNPPHDIHQRGERRDM